MFDPKGPMWLTFKGEDSFWLNQGSISQNETDTNNWFEFFIDLGLVTVKVHSCEFQQSR